MDLTAQNDSVNRSDRQAGVSESSQPSIRIAPKTGECVSDVIGTSIVQREPGSGPTDLRIERRRDPHEIANRIVFKVEGKVVGIGPHNVDKEVAHPNGCRVKVSRPFWYRFRGV